MAPNKLSFQQVKSPHSWFVDYFSFRLECVWSSRTFWTENQICVENSENGRFVVEVLLTESTEKEERAMPTEQHQQHQHEGSESLCERMLLYCIWMCRASDSGGDWWLSVHGRIKLNNSRILLLLLKKISRENFRYFYSLRAQIQIFFGTVSPRTQPFLLILWIVFHSQNLPLQCNVVGLNKTISF